MFRVGGNVVGGPAQCHSDPSGGIILRIGAMSSLPPGAWRSRVCRRRRGRAESRHNRKERTGASNGDPYCWMHFDGGILDRRVESFWSPDRVLLFPPLARLYPDLERAGRDRCGHFAAYAHALVVWVAVRYFGSFLVVFRRNERDRTELALPPSAFNFVNSILCSSHHRFLDRCPGSAVSILSILYNRQAV